MSLWMCSTCLPIWHEHMLSVHRLNWAAKLQPSVGAERRRAPCAHFSSVYSLKWHQASVGNAQPRCSLVRPDRTGLDSLLFPALTWILKAHLASVGGFVKLTRKTDLNCVTKQRRHIEKQCQCHMSLTSHE